MIEQKKRTTLVVLASSSSTPTPSSSNADRVLDATSPTSGLVDRYSSLLREFRRAKAELGGAAWLAQWRADHGGARPTLEDARRVGAPRALRSYVETRERLLAETPVLREEIGVAGLLLRRGGGGGASEGAGEGTGATTTATAAATATRSARAQAALTMGVAADYRKRRASEQAAVAKVERVVQAEGEATEGAAVSAQAPAAGSSRVRAAALAALAYKKKGGATVDTNDMPKPSAAVSVLASLLKESPPKPVADEAGEGQQQAAPAPVVAAFESAKGDVAAAMAATPRGRDKRRVGAAEGAGLAQVVL
jgi:hypothetical protein